MAQGPPPPPNLNGPTKVTLRLLRWFRDGILANWIVSSDSVVVHRHSGGTCSLEVVNGGGGSGLIRAKTGGSTIASGASASVTLYDADHTLGADTLTAFNRTPNTIGADKVVYVAWIAREAEYQIVNEVC